MYLIFKKTSESVSSYNRMTSGYQYIDDAVSIEKANGIINNREANYIFDQEDGTIRDESQREVFDPAYPTDWDFGDYSYTIIDLEDGLNSDQIAAVKKDAPYNMEEILEQL